MSYSGGATSTVERHRRAFGLGDQRRRHAVTRPTIYGSASNDVFWSWEGYSVLENGAQYNYAIGFGDVSADVTGATGGAYGAVLGGSDAAYLFDSSGADTFRAGPDMAKMFYESTKTGEASGFDYVTAVGVYGGTDAAYLYGSSGGDAYYGYADHQTLFGTGLLEHGARLRLDGSGRHGGRPGARRELRSGFRRRRLRVVVRLDLQRPLPRREQRGLVRLQHGLDDRAARPRLRERDRRLQRQRHRQRTQREEVGNPTFPTIYTGDGWI